MARRRQVRRRGGRRRPRRGYNGKKRALGGMLRGRMHPPTNSASPWNSSVITFQWQPTPAEANKTFVTVQSLSADTVVNNLCTELGVSGLVDIRVSRIDVWTQPQIANSTRNTIVMAPIDWTRCGTAALNWFEAWGTVAQPAHAHYVWPRSLTNEVIVAGSTCPIVRFDVRDAKFAFIIKTHVLWRKTDPDPLTVEGKTYSLRGPRGLPPPPDEGFEIVTGGSAMSPLARVVDAFSLRS